MATLTTNLSLIKPAVNSAVDEDLWGDQLNTNLDTVDSEHALKTINLDFNNKVLSQAEMKDISETTYDFSADISSGVLALDYLNGGWQYGTLTENITTFSITNLPATTKGGWLTVEFIQDGTGSRTLDLTGGTFLKAGGGSVTLTTAAGASDELYFKSRDNGTTIKVASGFDWGVIV